MKKNQLILKKGIAVKRSEIMKKRTKMSRKKNKRNGGVTMKTKMNMRIIKISITRILMKIIMKKRMKILKILKILMKVMKFIMKERGG